MKKLTVRKYAKLLYTLTDQKSAEEIKSVLEGFVGLMAKQKQIKMANKVIAEFGKIYYDRKGIVLAEVLSARELDEKSLAEIKEWIAKNYKSEKVEIENKVKSSLKGGVVISVGDEVLDLSVERKMMELKETIRG